MKESSARGDKQETDKVEHPALSRYVEQTKIVCSDINNIFIATDDYRVIRELKDMCPGWNIITFCTPDNEGFYENKLLTENKQAKKNHLIALLTDIHFLVESQVLIGDYASNIMRLVALLKGRENIHSLGVAEWHAG